MVWGVVAVPNQADGTEGLYVDVPEALKYQLDKADRTNKEIVIAGIERELGIASEDSVAVLNRQIKRLEERLETAKSEFEHHRDQMQSIQSDLERAREIRDEKTTSQEAYEDALDGVLDDLEAGDPEHLFPQHPKLDGLREEFDKPTEELHLELQQRAAEQERDLTVAHFKQAYKATLDDEETPITDQWSTEVDDE